MTERSDEDALRLRYARLAQAIDDRYRESLQAAIQHAGLSQEAEIEIAGAVVALLLRRMYRERGRAWLERVLEMVLTDP